MGRKVFVSYKYGDTSVEDLNIYEDTFWGKQKVQTKVRHYVNELSNILSNEDHIYKGEDDGQSLADFSDEYIASSLRDKIYDSSITIVIVSKGMKNTMQDEKNQWIPWEISYSLSEYKRNDRKSLTNAMLAIILPDKNNSYSYYIHRNECCNNSCTTHHTGILFEIISKNKFNLKSPNLHECNNNEKIYYDNDPSYIKAVKWDEFIKNIDKFIAESYNRLEKINDYNIYKSMS